jgi:surface antigen
MHRFLALPLFVALAAASPAASALNWVPLMKNTPFERFDEDDLQMFLENARKTLNGAPDKQTVTWENPDTKHGGDFTVLKTWQKDGLTCRQLHVRTQADTRKGNSVVSACQVKGKWKLIGAPVKQK